MVSRPGRGGPDTGQRRHGAADRGSGTVQSHPRRGEVTQSHCHEEVTHWSQVTHWSHVTRDMEMEMEHYYEDSHLLESATPYTDAIRVSHFVNICIFTSYLKVEKICRNHILQRSYMCISPFTLLDYV